MKKTLLVLLAVCGLLYVTGTLSAHHSTAMYSQDAKTVTGKVVKWEWTNPHAHVYIEVTENGKTTVWDCEMMSLNHLRSYGWTSKTVKLGDVISATGRYARSGDPSMIANRMKLADGREIAS